MIRLFAMFSGYGGAEFALKKAEIPFKCVAYSEIDKDAIKCHELNFPMDLNWGDCTKINPQELPDFDLLTGGFPCQDFSIAGKGLGELNIRGTLFHEIIRIAEIKKPTYMLLENVRGLVCSNHKATFDKIIKELHRIGYGTIYKICNSANYGIPQSRERIFIVCKYGGWKFGEFQFPKEVPLKLRIKDILEENVSSSYDLSESQIQKIEEQVRHMDCRDINEVSDSLCSREYKDGGKMIRLDAKDTSRGERVYSEQGIIGSIGTHSTQAGSIFALRSWPRSGNKEKDGERFQRFEERGEVANSLTGVAKDNLVVHNMQPRSPDRPSLAYSSGGSGHLQREDGVTYCVDGSNSNVIQNQKIYRHLTPKECFRLMGFLKDEIYLEGLSESAKYKLAGNGWDINFVSLIFKEMFKGWM